MRDGVGKETGGLCSILGSGGGYKLGQNPHEPDKEVFSEAKILKFNK